MAERRSLVEGVNPPPITKEEKALEKQFVYGNAAATEQTNNRIPLTSRIRPDLYKALKRASLERQLEGETPHNVQDILEVCLEPWLKNHGYLR